MEQEIEKLLDDYCFGPSGLNVDQIVEIIIKNRKFPKIFSNPNYHKNQFSLTGIIDRLIKNNINLVEEMIDDMPFDIVFPMFVFRKQKEQIVKYLPRFKNLTILKKLINYHPYLVDLIDEIENVDIDLQIHIAVLTNFMSKIVELMDDHLDKIVTEARNQKNYNLIRNLKNSNLIQFDCDFLCELINQDMITTVDIVKFQANEDEKLKIIDAIIKRQDYILIHAMDQSKLLSKNQILKIKEAIPNFKIVNDISICPFNDKMEHFEINNAKEIENLLKNWDTEFYDMISKNPTFFIFEPKCLFRYLDFGRFVNSDNFNQLFQFWLNSYGYLYACRVIDLSMNLEIGKKIFNSEECLNYLYKSLYLPGQITTCLKEYITLSNDKECLTVFFNFVLNNDVKLSANDLEKLK